MGDAVGVTPTDAELMAASLHDPQQFALIFDRHARAVHRYVAFRANLGDVDDVVSEAFLTAFRTRARYDRAYDSALPWLLGIATHVLNHHRRSEGRRLTRLRAAAQAPETEFDLAETVAAGVDDAAETERVARALARLDDRYRDILLLAAGADLTYDEIARALGIPIGTVRSRLARGRRRLRELLDPGGQHKSDRPYVTPSTEGTPG
ncbi:MAG: RNA polymerase sigma factor [Acidimicrobiales bacterium]|jgi:RNA polymerase sigma-70 factor (ECF subfamily)